MASSTSSNLPDGDDLKQRVARVEGIAHDLIERQLRTITVIFGLVSAVIVAAGVLVSVLAIYGKIEVRDATREMERKFEVLAGQALKVPVLQILYEGTELDQKVITVKAPTGGVLQFSEIQLKNTGSRATEFVSVRVLLGGAIDAGAEWQSTPSGDKDFPAAAFFGGPYHISPQETWTLPRFFGVVKGALPEDMPVKLQAFYGQERPAEARRR